MRAGLEGTKLINRRKCQQPSRVLGVVAGSDSQECIEVGKNWIHGWGVVRKVLLALAAVLVAASGCLFDPCYGQRTDTAVFYDASLPHRLPGNGTHGGFEVSREALRSSIAGPVAALDQQLGAGNYSVFRLEWHPSDAGVAGFDRNDFYQAQSGQEQQATFRFVNDCWFKDSIQFNATRPAFNIFLLTVAPSLTGADADRLFDQMRANGVKEGGCSYEVPLNFLFQAGIVWGNASSGGGIYVQRVTCETKNGWIIIVDQQVTVLQRRKSTVEDSLVVLANGHAEYHLHDPLRGGKDTMAAHLAFLYQNLGLGEPPTGWHLDTSTCWL